MQTGNYVVTAAAIDIWLPPRGKRGWGARLSLQALKRRTLMILTENRGWISETDRSTRWILYPCRQKSVQAQLLGCFYYLMRQIFPIAAGSAGLYIQLLFSGFRSGAAAKYFCYPVLQNVCAEQLRKQPPH